MWHRGELPWHALIITCRSGVFAGKGKSDDWDAKEEPAYGTLLCSVKAEPIFQTGLSIMVPFAFQLGNRTSLAATQPKLRWMFKNISKYAINNPFSSRQDRAVVNGTLWEDLRHRWISCSQVRVCTCGKLLVFLFVFPAALLLPSQTPNSGSKN